ncbi:signal recognition particle subunit srp68 [Lecanora helva]
MDITNFIVSQREKALLFSDYESYRKQLSRRLLVVRKKLNYTSPKSRKYAPKPPVTTEDVANNHEFAHLLLLTAERAWAQAMYMKSSHSADGAKRITGSTKQHIGSRLHKASAYAGHLLTLLKDQATSKANSEAILEARAYYVSLLASNSFEKQHWEPCLHDFSKARLIYTTLAQSKGAKEGDIFRDLLNNTIDPSIRYAAYQLKLPRTTSIDSIVSKYVPRTDNEFVEELLKQNPEALNDPAATKKQEDGKGIVDVPKIIQWRSRTVDLEDAATAQALATVMAAKEKLAAYLKSNTPASPQAKGAAYDEVLIPSQDAVDATKTAIDELSTEGVSQSDRRMQALQITRTAVNYALVGWRVGRNRVLCGEGDAATLDHSVPKHRSKRRLEDVKSKKTPMESNGRKMTRLKERVVLYDSTLQSLDSVKELPGVAADQQFLGELQAKRSYFAALRCLTIALSHSLLQQRRNALALSSRALDLVSTIPRQMLASKEALEEAPNLEVTSAQVQDVQNLLERLVLQQRALVELHNFDASEKTQANLGKQSPLVERLDEYGPVDLTKLVTYPPKIRAIPVKPLFLDVAFNYIDYPGRTRQGKEKAVNGVTDDPAGREQKKEGKRGWFSFGR